MEELLGYVTSGITIVGFIGGAGAVVWQSKITAQKVAQLDKTVHNGISTEVADARNLASAAVEAAERAAEATALGLAEIKADLKEVKDDMQQTKVTLAVMKEKVSMRGCANFKDRTDT